MYNTSYIMMEEFYIMEEIKRLVYSRELRWNEIMVIAMRLFRENIKVIAAGMLVIGLPISILLTLIQGRVMSMLEIADQVSAKTLVLSPQESVNLIQQMMTNNVLLMAVTVFFGTYIHHWCGKGCEMASGRQTFFCQQSFCGSNVIGTRCGESGYCVYDPVFAGNPAGDSCHLSGRCMVSVSVLHCAGRQTKC